jgi:aflatoxin B1 aldehyde reductase
LLFPTLRELGIAIQAYSPIAGGFLAKTPEFMKNPESDGRWNPTGGLGSMYHVLYNKPSFLRYLEEYEKLANEAGLGKVEMAYRWIVFNSMLDGSKGDGLVIGASRASQLEETLKVLQRGPLEKWVVERLDEMWNSVEKDAAVDNFKAYEEIVAGN